MMDDESGKGATTLSRDEMSVRLGNVSALDPRIIQFLRYWQRICGERSMPRRADVDPLDMSPDTLPNVILTEALDGGARHRYRLVGSEIETASRCRLTGGIVGEAIPVPEYRAYILGLYETVTTLRRPLLSVSNFGHPELDHIVTQRIMCPLSEDGATVDMILTCQLFDTHPDQWRDVANIAPGTFQKLFEAAII